MMDEVKHEESKESEVLIAELEKHPVHDTACMRINHEVMKRYGFAFGDSLTFTFSNGLCIVDVPYHDGYYIEPGKLIAVTNPGDSSINIAFNIGKPSWEAFNLKEGDTLTVTMHEKGKYLREQELFSQVHSDDPKDYSSAESFSNFRAIRGGRLKPNWVYRSASMTNNERNRRATVNALMKKYGINTALCLSEKEETLREQKEKGDWVYDRFDELYETGNAIPIGLGIFVASEKFHRVLSKGLLAMCEKSGPYLISCMEGKDRTGYACALLEGLAGADYAVMKEDYLKTYENYYGLKEEEDPEGVRQVLDFSFDPVLRAMFELEEGETLAETDFVSGAKLFLRKGGLKEEEIARIEEALMEQKESIN